MKGSEPMPVSKTFYDRSLLLMVAGAKGAVASTLAAAVAALQQNAAQVVPCLTTGHKFAELLPLHKTRVAGWDVNGASISAAVACQGVLPPHVCETYGDALSVQDFRQAPPETASLKEQVEKLMQDIQAFKSANPHAVPVLINLLPAGKSSDLQECRHLDEVFQKATPETLPDLAYVLAAILSDAPVVNFTPNEVELPVFIETAQKRGVPLAGRDGKTGQTYFKVVLASALKARSLHIDGWYSLNILGNADGMNLMDPERAAGKMANKTQLLDEILGYPVGERYGTPSHKVHIDYYPPRGDAKEAWDVIDFSGLFDLPMSLRLNLQGRDSILAAPMAIDIGRWMAVIQAAGRSGLTPELGFFFKKPLGSPAPLTFEDQMEALKRLEDMCLG
jgi:myo-inositol-1-phosphate synthase